MIAAPGTVYAANFALAALALGLSNPPRGTLLRRLLIGFGLTALNILFAHVTDLDIIALYFPTLVFALGIAGLILHLICDMPAENTVYFTLHAFIAGEFSSAFSWQICLFLLRRGLLAASPFRLNLLCLLLSALVLAGLGFYCSRLSEEHAHFRADRRTLISTGLTVLGIFLFSNISDVFTNTPFSGNSAFEINLIRMLADAGGLILLESARSHRAEVQRAAQLQIMDSLLQAQYSNFKTSERSMALIHQKYHDLKHQIAYLREDAHSPDGLAGLDRLEREIRSFEAISSTGNHVLDTILTDKTLQCQQLEISLTFTGDGRLLDFLPPMDLAALLGNLLDNAIEYVSGLSGPAQRWIELSVRKNAGFIVLEVTNPAGGDIQFENGLPKSTKGDDRYHGFGTMSVRETGERYGGSAGFTLKNGCFTAKVSFAAPSA